MRCRCGYAFKLDPKTDGYADGRILASYKRASGDSAHFITNNQMLTAALSLQKWKGTFVFGVLFAGSSLVALLSAGMGAWGKGAGNAAVPMLVFLVVGAGLILGSLYARSNINSSKFLAAVKKFQSKGGSLPKLLVAGRLLVSPPPDWNESDIHDYGAEAILIVDREATVDLLVLNTFHATSRVVIVGESGYPEYIVPRVNQILASQPDVLVFVLHDANDSAKEMVKRVPLSSVIHLKGQNVTDLGLHTSDLRRMPKLRRFRQPAGVPVDHLSWSRLSASLAAGIADKQSIADVIEADHEANLLSFG